MKHCAAPAASALLLAVALPLAARQSDDPQGATTAAETGGPNAASEQAPNIYPNLAARLVEMGVPVIDVRSADEVERTGIIDGAAQIPHTEVGEIAERIGDDADRAVVVYCGSGRRAGRVIDALRDRGYSGLVNAGGYDDLRRALGSEADESESIR